MEPEEKEESIEDLFNQFINAVKALPKDDKDKLAENLNEIDKNK